uniref:hypothetical protein n=1 Tax=Sphingomonas sp. AR_OL41 TaxID=3042729 RepID=UPI002481626A|nr:hypothetical protein [Sphingomonas sp. AR_OL41]
MVSAMSRRSADHLFFPAMALLLAGETLLGFWHTYIGAGFMLARMPSLLVHVHAVLFVGWMTLFTVQTLLVARGRVAVHRRLGGLMGWWAAAMVVAGPATVIMALRRPGSGIDATILAGDLAQTVAFVVLLSTGLARRAYAAEHKRLMTLATAAIIGPALSRWPFAIMHATPPVGIVMFYLLPPVLMLLYDLAVLRRVHRATAFGLVMMVLVLACFVALPATSAWLAFADWVQHA